MKPSAPRPVLLNPTVAGRRVHRGGTSVPLPGIRSWTTARAFAAEMDLVMADSATSTQTLDRMRAGS